MLQRRRFVSGLAWTAIGFACAAQAQRPTQPIARPPAQRLAGALVKGRFDSSGGVASGATPGIYVVVAVDTQADTLQLRDDTGRTGTVHVAAHSFELDTLQAGDEVEVDFLVPEPGNTRLEAGGIWKVER